MKLVLLYVAYTLVLDEASGTKDSNCMRVSSKWFLFGERVAADDALTKCARQGPLKIGCVYEKRGPSSRSPKAECM
jgi:hypothetical protein